MHFLCIIVPVVEIIQSHIYTKQLNPAWCLVAQLMQNGKKTTFVLVLVSVLSWTSLGLNLVCLGLGLVLVLILSGLGSVLVSV